MIGINFPGFFQVNVNLMIIIAFYSIHEQENILNYRCFLLIYFLSDFHVTEIMPYISCTQITMSKSFVRYLS